MEKLLGFILENLISVASTVGNTFISNSFVGEDAPTF